MIKKCSQGVSISEAFTIADQLFLSPMSATIMFLLKLAKSKDALAIEYLSEAVEFAKQQMESGV